MDATIGDHTFIGPFVEIQRNAKIGSHCKLQSHSFICELTEIGDHVFVGHGVMFINDLFSEGGPANGDQKKWKPTRIGNHVFTRPRSIAHVAEKGHCVVDHPV